MLLNLLCTGTSISFSNFDGLFWAAGRNSRVTLIDSHWQPPSNLHGLMVEAGEKKLTIDASANFFSIPQITELLSSAKGAATELQVGRINNYSPQDIVSVVGLLSGKTYSLEIACQAINAANVAPLIEALRSVSGQLNFDSANALPQELLAIILSGVAGKPASFVLNGKLSSPERTIGAISQVSAYGFTSSLVDPQYIPLPQLTAAFAAAGEQRLHISLDLEFFPAHVIKGLVNSAGPLTTIRINSAHVLRTADLLEVISLSAGRPLGLIFNGRQLTVDPVDGDKLQQVINASSMSQTISINTAQYPPLSYLLPLISSSAHTKLNLSYNGNQLSETEPHGNVVVRGIQAAQESTSITITSVGARNFNLSHYLGILAAAG